MSLKNCCSSKDIDSKPSVNVNVNVDVPKIVKYSCVAGVLIVGIIFAAKCFHKLLEKGLFDIVEE
jgi:hypothetical protein